MPLQPEPGSVPGQERFPPRKKGACTDYFPPEGVSPNINAELAALGQPPLPTTSFRGVLRPVPEGRTTVSAISDGTSNTILFGECAGREDVWRDGRMTPAVANKSLSTCARAQGGAWATNDNPYEIGVRKLWCGAGTNPALPAAYAGPMKINATNEYGFLFYSFHSSGANFGFADGSVRFIRDSASLSTLAALSTRAGGEVIANDF
jgi:prepilin-type processing-associated H-X9-DG protein